MTSLSDRRNRTGVAFMRSRIIARARTVSRDPVFRQAIETFRISWNSRVPRHSVPVVASMQALRESPLVVETRISFVLRSWQDDVSHNGTTFSIKDADWHSDLGDLCEQFFPFEDFGDGRYDGEYSAWNHPAMLFVSACVFCPAVVVVEDVEELIPALSLDVSSLPFPPDPLDKFLIERLRGELRFWRYLALDPFMEHTSDEDLEALIKAADVAGWQYAAEQGDLLGVKVPAADRWWYLPLTPFTTAKDIRDAAPHIAEKMRTIYGGRPIDERIRRKLLEGKTQSQVAAELGISKDMVSEALKAMVDGESPGTGFEDTNPTSDE